MNILVTAIGSFAGEEVIKSLKANPDCKVIGTDIYPSDWIPNSKHCDQVYQCPLAITGELFISKILEICKYESIKFVAPLTDPEVDVFAKNKSLFDDKGINICISDPKVIEICRDKLCVYQIFKNDSNVNVIPTFEAGQFSRGKSSFPFFAKPRKGRSSEGVIKINNDLDFQYFKNKIEASGYIIQPFLDGNIFTVDVVRNKSENVVQTISREELIRNFNGAGLTVRVMENKELERASKYIAERLDINGCVNFEFILHKEKFFLMDINPRFSAGVAFSAIAGYDVVKNHLNCFLSLPIEKKEEFNTMIITKNYTEVILKD